MLKKILLIPHYLSLDAVLVALCWCFFGMEIYTLFLPQKIYPIIHKNVFIGLSLAVWVIYLSDHLLDVKKIRPEFKKNLNQSQRFVQRRYNLVLFLTIILAIVLIFVIFPQLSLNLVIHLAKIFCICIDIFFAMPFLQKQA